MKGRVFIRSHGGQSLAEYAVLFGIVLGAAVAMQFYVRGRLQSAIQQRADEFHSTAGTTALLSETGRKTKSTSVTKLDMETALKGKVDIDSVSETTADLKK